MTPVFPFSPWGPGFPSGPIGPTSPVGPRGPAMPGFPAEPFVPVSPGSPLSPKNVSVTILKECTLFCNGQSLKLNTNNIIFFQWSMVSVYTWKYLTRLANRNYSTENYPILTFLELFLQSALRSGRCKYESFFLSSLPLLFGVASPHKTAFLTSLLPKQ